MIASASHNSEENDKKDEASRQQVAIAEVVAENISRVSGRRS